jgi:hypothetical protein
MESLEPRPELTQRQVRRLTARALKRESRANHWHQRAEVVSGQLADATSDSEVSRHSHRLLGVQRMYEKDAEKFSALMDKLYGPGWEDKLSSG